jgi:hypothetical protein
VEGPVVLARVACLVTPVGEWGVARAARGRVVARAGGVVRVVRGRRLALMAGVARPACGPAPVVRGRGSEPDANPASAGGNRFAA